MDERGLIKMIQTINRPQCKTPQTISESLNAGFLSTTIGICTGSVPLQNTLGHEYFQANSESQVESSFSKTLYSPDVLWNLAINLSWWVTVFPFTHFAHISCQDTSSTVPWTANCPLHFLFLSCLGNVLAWKNTQSHSSYEDVANDVVVSVGLETPKDWGNIEMDPM